MWDALHVGMSLTVIGFVALAFVVMMVVLAALIRQLRSKSGQLTQFGDTSLTPRSVNWLAATAAAGAMFVCFGLR